MLTRGNLRAAVCSVAVIGLLLTACSSTASAPVSTSSAPATGSSTPIDPTSSASSRSVQTPAGTTPSAESPPATSATGAWPTGLTPAEQASAQAALDAYAGFWRAKDAAAMDPTGQDWSAELSKYADSDIVLGAMDYLRSLIDAEQHQQGSVKLASRVVSVTTEAVTVRSCFDGRDVTVVDSAGTAIDDGTIRAAGVQTALVQAQPDGLLKVTKLINPSPIQPC